MEPTVIAYSPEEFGTTVGTVFDYLTVSVPIPLFVLLLLGILVWRFTK